MGRSTFESLVPDGAKADSSSNSAGSSLRRHLLSLRLRRIVSEVFEFIESSAFQRACPVYLDDDEYAELQQFMMQHPEAGQVVPGSGGVRKLRWARQRTGKRGGLRVIYFVRYAPNELWLLTIYAKSELDNAPSHLLRKILEAFRDE